MTLRERWDTQGCASCKDPTRSSARSRSRSTTRIKGEKDDIISDREKRIMKASQVLPQEQEKSEATDRLS